MTDSGDNGNPGKRDTDIRINTMDGDGGYSQTIAAEATEVSPLRISLSNSGPSKEISVLRIDGIVDTMTSGELDRIVSSLITRGRYRLIIDLAGVEYISSAGWGIFVSYLREIRQHAGDIKLARMTPEVREIYELLEFDGLLPAFERLDAAEADFRLTDGHATTAIPPSISNGPKDESKAETAPEGSTRPADMPDKRNLEDAVLTLVAEDPFYTISELRDRLREHSNGRLRAGWWKVFICLQRHRMLTRRARFRHYRHHKKTAR